MSLSFKTLILMFLQGWSRETEVKERQGYKMDDLNKKFCHETSSVNEKVLRRWGPVTDYRMVFD